MGSALAAQDYPTRPIRMIVPFASGGNADIQARIIGQQLAAALGQQVVIDNRAGANSIIGTELAAKAAPDGYTLLFGGSGHVTNSSLYGKLPFDPVRDFAAVSLVGSTALILSANPALPVKSVSDLIALAKARPGALSFASQGNASPGHLAGALLNTLASIQILHVPYKSTAQAITDLISGQIQLMYPSMTAILPHIKTGKVRGIAITSARRSALTPELPTMIELGVPGYEAGIWNGILAPAGTPQKLIARLNSEIVAILKAPQIRVRFATLGAEPGSSTPQEFDAFIRAEIAKWSKTIRESGARLD